MNVSPQPHNATANPPLWERFAAVRKYDVAPRLGVFRVRRKILRELLIKAIREPDSPLPGIDPPQS